MDKLTMAMEMIVAEVRRVGICSIDSEKVADAWNIADAMQAEADKREKEEAEQKRKEMRELLKHLNTFIEKEGMHFDDVNFEVDWDLAPPEATTWKTVNNVAIWIAAHGQPLCTAPTFGFTGSCVVDRPEMEAKRHG